MKLVPALVAEAIGVFALSFLGILAIHAGGGLVGVAIAHGLTLGLVITAFAATSGGHINPAVTVALLVGGKIKLGPAIAYIIAQVIGGLLAGLAVIAIFVVPTPPAPTSALQAKSGNGADIVSSGTPAIAEISPNVKVITTFGGFFAEFIATFFLVTMVWGTAVDARAPKFGGMGVGLIVLADILAIGPLTGGAMNPARATGPALAALIGGAQYDWANHWIYWAGPVCGGILASVIYKGLMLPKDQA